LQFPDAAGCRIYSTTPVVHLVVPNLENTAKSGKYFVKNGRGDGGFRVLGLSECEVAW
jgi:hypothetical protein